MNRLVPQEVENLYFSHIQEQKANDLHQVIQNNIIQDTL